MDAAPVQQYDDPFGRELAGQRFGRYEILTKLASGGMAAVYVARAQSVAGFERLFAIKILHPHLAYEEEFISMFLDEARLAARIHHPNVVATIDVSDTGHAGYYLVMDYIEGDHLGALLQRAFKAQQRISAPLVLRVVVDALNGLAAAHNLTDENGNRLNLVHRDVSPHNLMVGTDGISRLTDFGVAKAEVRLSNTREGQFKGKLAYMAPEHASSGTSDQRSDLFSMGIILWECLTGRRLFRAENHAATLNKICIEPIPLPSSVDPDLAPFDPILEKALAREPDERFQSAEDFSDAIERSAHELGGLASLRTVGKLVNELAGDKLVEERDMIRAAIARVAEQEPGESAPSTSGPSAPPSAPPPAGSPAERSATASGASGQASAAGLAVPNEYPHEMPQAGSGGRFGLSMGLLFTVLLAVAAGVGVVYFQQQRSDPTTRTLKPAEPTHPTEAEAKAADTEAAGEQKAEPTTGEIASDGSENEPATATSETQEPEKTNQQERDGTPTEGSREEAEARERRRAAERDRRLDRAPEMEAASPRERGGHDERTAPRPDEPEPKRSEGEEKKPSAEPDPFDDLLNNPYRQ